MTRYQEKKQVDPRELKAGDQVACIDTGPRLTILTGAAVDDEHGIDEVWVSLHNDPGSTTQVWDQPVRPGSVALQLGEHQWTVAVLPQVLARRRVA